MDTCPLAPGSVPEATMGLPVPVLLLAQVHTARNLWIRSQNGNRLRCRPALTNPPPPRLQRAKSGTASFQLETRSDVFRPSEGRRSRMWSASHHRRVFGGLGALTHRRIYPQVWTTAGILGVELLWMPRHPCTHCKADIMPPALSLMLS